MDEEVENLSQKWEPQDISDIDNVFRQVPKSHLDENLIPKDSTFALREHIKEQSLSVNLCSLITAENNFKLIGIQQKRSGDWLNPEKFLLYKFPVEFLKTLINFEAVTHTPSFKGAPSPVGRPNNKAHTSLSCGQFDDRTRMQMRDYCESSSNPVQFEVLDIIEEINELRARANDTPFHYYWNFD